LKFAVPQILPGEVLKPGMILDLCWSVQPESIRRLSLDHLVNEVSGLDRPPLRNFVSLNLHLLSKDVIANLLT
jgi:hypothetical protein